MDRSPSSTPARGVLHGVGLAASRTLSGIRTWQVFLVALALRFPIVWLRPLEAHAENIKAGFTLAQRGYLGDPFSIPTGPTAHVAPAYPALVAAVRSYLLVYLLIQHDIRYMYPALFLESLIAGSFVVMLVRIWRARHTRCSS